MQNLLSILSALAAVINWISTKVPAPNRMPVTFFLFASIGFFYIVYEAPKHLQKAFDNRWEAKAAPFRKIRDDQIKDINHKIDTLSGNMGNMSNHMELISSDTQVIKACLLNKTCGR